MCVCMRARARARVCVCACVTSRCKLTVSRFQESHAGHHTLHVNEEDLTTVISWGVLYGHIPQTRDCELLCVAILA